MSSSFRVIVKVVLAHLICDVSAALKSAMCAPSDTWFGHPRGSGLDPAHGNSGNSQQGPDIFDDWTIGPPLEPFSDALANVFREVRRERALG